MEKLDLRRIAEEVKRENMQFAEKSLLDNLTLPSKIIGREYKAKELVRLLLSYKQGHVVPFISVFGRSGSGKSTIVKFVCENLDEDEISSAFVNLRKAKTVFGCANLILTEIGEPTLKSAQGINLANERISDGIEALLSRSSKRKKKSSNSSKNKKTEKNIKLFVLVLDEFDVLYYDKRGKPSDFIYKLLVTEEKLREKGFLMCIIAISTNVIADYEVDDRIKSRIGSSEVFFEPYTKEDVRAILKDRAKGAFSEPIDSKILEYCADQTSEEYGDARRAIDLLRVAAEIAGKGGEKINRNHVNAALEKLQNDRVNKMLSSAPYHLKLTAAALARFTYLTQEVWHSTSTIYNQYRHILTSEGNYYTNRNTNNPDNNFNPLTYRRISELLTELENMGLVTSQTGSKGRHGYGTQYKLVIPPEVVGRVCFPSSSSDWWDIIVRRKKEHDREMGSKDLLTSMKNTIRVMNTKTSSGQNKNNSGILDAVDNLFGSGRDDSWKKFVGSEEE